MIGISLYHATSPDAAESIRRAGFRGADVWDHRSVVFLADQPLRGLGDAWVRVTVSAAWLSRADEYDETERENDESIYHARCYCVRARRLNRAIRRMEIVTVGDLIEEETR